MEKEKEEDIIRRVRAGETEPFRLLVDAYRENIFALIIKMLGKREDAEELTQDVFVKAFFSLDKFRGDSSFSTWLYRIAYNITISKLRKKERLTFSDSIEKMGDSPSWEEEEVLDKMIKEEKFEKIEVALQSITSQERFLIVSFYEGGKSLKELTEITGMSLSNVKIKLFRIKKKLYDECRKI